MKALYGQRGAQLDIDILASDEAQSFINAHAGILDSTFKQVKMSDKMRERLTRSNYIFSGIKTFHELNEAFPSLLDENGDRKPFERFLNDVRKIDETYNANYLHAEYNFVQASAEMAAKWEQYSEDGDRYLLQYRTAHDDKVRPEHAALDRITLPMSDPFWESYYPPNGWNCFVAGTPVLTMDGWKGIESIKKGDLVIGGSGKVRKVIGTHAHTVDDELVCVITKGAMATCTPNHRFCTPHGWVDARSLHKGDIIIQVGENSTLHLIVHAIANTRTLLRYGLMACVRKWKAIASLTVDDKVEGRNEEVNDVTSKKLSETAFLRDIPVFCGIKDIHAFDGFNSFFDFLRNTFFHNRYVLVEGKVTKKKRETTVYNLSIFKDESYIVPIGITHNCRCTVVQVRRGKYEETPHNEAMSRGEEVLNGEKLSIFRFNSGKQGKTMPDYNPYTIKRCTDCDVAKGKLGLVNEIVDNQLCAACRIVTCLADNRANKSNENKAIYDKIIKDKSYKDIQYDERSGGVKATHIEHNIDEKKGWYETTVQDVGFKNGHSVILGAEPQNVYKHKWCEGTWDKLPFEIAGAESATANNIRNALKHCASKPETKIAVLFFPNENFTHESFLEGLAKYNGLRKTSQYKKFDLIYCIQKDKIVQIKKPG